MGTRHGSPVHACAAFGFSAHESGMHTEVRGSLLGQSKIDDLALAQKQKLVEERVHLHSPPSVTWAVTAYYTSVICVTGAVPLARHRVT